MNSKQKPSIEDVTDEIETKQNLEKRRELSNISREYQFIMNNVADVIMQVTLTGKITYITQNCESHYGYKQNEVIGKKFTKFAPKSEWPKYFFKIKQMLSGKKIHTFETIVLHKNGHQIPVDFSGQMIKSNGKSFFHAVMRNITERKKIDNERRKIDGRYKLILENSNCPVTYLDLEGNIILINKIGAKNLKENPGYLIGKSIYDMLPEFAYEQKKRINAILKIKYLFCLFEFLFSMFTIFS